VPILHEDLAFTNINISRRKFHPYKVGNGKLFMRHPGVFLCGYGPSFNAAVVCQHERKGRQRKVLAVQCSVQTYNYFCADGAEVFPRGSVTFSAR
jgi:hypothetical protein